MKIDLLDRRIREHLLQYRRVADGVRRGVHLPETKSVDYKTYAECSRLDCVDGDVPPSLLGFGRDGNLGSFLLFRACQHWLSKWRKKAAGTEERAGQSDPLGIPRSLMFITPGALEVVLRFLSSKPATAESTLETSDVSADMMAVVKGLNEDRFGRGLRARV